MSDVLSQLQSYGDQLETTVPTYEFSSKQASGRQLPPWSAVVGIAASILVIVGVFIWALGRGDDSQTLDVIAEMPTATVEALGEPTVSPATSGGQDDAEAGAMASVQESDPEPEAPDTCEGLNPSLVPRQTEGRRMIRVVEGNIESDVGLLPAEIPAGSYKTDLLGVELTIESNECVTLVDENPGMVTVVAAGSPLEGAPWMTAVVPSSFSGPGVGERVDVPGDLLSWASTIDAVNASSLGSVSVGGLTGTEYELEVNTSSLDTVFCASGQCAAVMQPQVAWFRDNPGSLEIDTATRTRLIALDLDGTTVWIWRQAPAEDESFFAKTSRWLDGWSFGTTYEAIAHDGAFGPADAGPVALASGAVVSIPEPGWTVKRNTAVSASFLPPGSPPNGGATEVVQIAQSINRDLEALTFEETIEQFPATAEVVGWNLADAGPGTIGDFESRVFDAEGFGQAIGPAFVRDAPSAFTRIHVIQTGDKAWLVFVGGSTREAIDDLEALASPLLIDAVLPEPAW